MRQLRSKLLLFIIVVVWPKALAVNIDKEFANGRCLREKFERFNDRFVRWQVIRIRTSIRDEVSVHRGLLEVGDLIASGKGI